MSEETQNTEEQQAEATEPKAEKKDGVELNGLFAFKKGMSSIYNEAGEIVPVTVLEYEPWVVSQLKTEDNDGYQALQVACRPKKATKTSKAATNHFKKAGFENGAQIVREVRQEIPEGAKVGDKVALTSLTKGDSVRLTGFSKGRGFSGVIKRWGFGGGPASHGAKFHRQPGSIGNCNKPGRVMKGRKLPGQFGDVKVTVKNVEIVDVLTDENVVLVKGPVPGARNSLVQLMKV